MVQKLVQLPEDVTGDPIVVLLGHLAQQVPEESVSKCVQFARSWYEIPVLPIDGYNIDDVGDHGAEMWLFVFLWKGDIGRFGRALRRTRYAFHSGDW
jgi:hypothetical protein